MQDPNVNGAADPNAPPEAGSLDEVQAMIDEIRAIATRLLGDFSDLALAQWHLTRYVAIGSLTVWTIRLRTTLMIYGLVLISWIFFNVAVWGIAMDVTHYYAAPPLALVLLNVLTATGLHFWRKSVELR